MSFQAATEIIVDNEITLRRFSHNLDQQRFDTIVASREHLLPWLPWAHFYQSFDEMPKFIDGQIEAFEKGAVLGYDIIYKGQFAGAIDLHNFSAENRNCEIGYWLGKDFTGNGIMTRCADRITKYAFDEIDMHRVVIRAADKNTASWSVAERLDYVYEGTLREAELLDGVFYGTKIYSKLR